jgi:hypothetical protein
MQPSDSVYDLSVQDDLDLAVRNAMKNRSIRVSDSSLRAGTQYRTCQTSVRFADQNSDKNWNVLHAAAIDSGCNETKTSARRSFQNKEFVCPDLAQSRRTASALKRSCLRITSTSDRKQDRCLSERHCPEEKEQLVPNLDFVGSMIDWTSALLSKITPETSSAEAKISATLPAGGTSQPRFRAILV